MDNFASDNREATAHATRELAALKDRVDEARQLLSQLQKDIAAAERRLRDGASTDLLRTNEQLVLAMLEAQRRAEAAAHDIVFREVTAKLRLESKQLGEENRQMKETSRLKSQFLTNMSHELRTPLNAVIGFSELLRLGSLPPGSPKYIEFLDHIITAGHYLLQLISGVLDLTKAAAGKLDFDPEPVDLCSVSQEVVDMLRPTANRKSASITVDIAADIGELFVDRLRLKQVLSNLVSNAIKFSRAGGEVALRARRQGDASFIVEVEDHGIGIAPEDQSRLFVEFQQLDSPQSSRQEGTGIGLALTRLLVEGQGGSVGLRSILDQGSTFFFTLPRRTCAVSPSTV
ncbi:MAG: ATP-binding protein [Rubrivivax sp.]